MDIDTRDNRIVNIYTRVIELTNIVQTNRINNNLYYRLNRLTGILEAMLDHMEPDIIGYENPFVDRLRIPSAIPLGQSVMAIERAIYLYDRDITMGKYSPHEVKNSVGAKGGVNKIGVLEAILKIDEITSLVSPEDITDHEVDAIAIAYAIRRDVRLNPMILLN
jgi:Holliday junction resolvasome RuvABC endonuclease subunit